MKNNIVLCGFMGSGKSTVGKILAQKLNFTFKDSDECIEQRENMSVSEIFKTYGEEYFRKTESLVIKELSLQNGLVIATGGGAVLNSDNAAALRQRGTVIFLDVTPETVLERLKNDASRPLLQRKDKAEAITELLIARKPVYQAAAHYAVNANRDALKTVEEILTLQGI